MLATTLNIVATPASQAVPLQPTNIVVVQNPSEQNVYVLLGSSGVTVTPGTNGTNVPPGTALHLTISTNTDLAVATAVGNAQVELSFAA